MPGLLPERFASLKIGMYVAGREWGERKVERTAKGGVQVRGMEVQKREGGRAAIRGVVSASPSLPHPENVCGKRHLIADSAGKSKSWSHLSGRLQTIDLCAPLRKLA